MLLIWSLVCPAGVSVPCVLDLNKHNSDNVRLFMDQEPSFQVAKFVYECMEFRRSEECEDYNPYFDW